jgi:hypothetical protein
LISSVWFDSNLLKKKNMSQKRNKKKKIPQKQNGEKRAMIRFKDLLYHALKEIRQEEHFHLIKESEFLRMFVLRVQVVRPRAKFGFQVGSKYLQKLNNHIQHYLRIPMVPCGEYALSTDMYCCLYALVYAREYFILGEDRKQFFKEKFKIDIDLSDKKQSLDSVLHAASYRAILALGNPRVMYFSYDNFVLKQDENHMARQVSPLISSYPAQSKMISIHGKHRPAFRLSVPYVNNGLKNMTVSADLLGDFYTGSQQEIDLYIQSHALNRLQERLDILHQAYLNFYLWFNTCQITEFVFYKNYLLLPVLIEDIRVGYFFANVIGDSLVFRTFLFITHSSTPEGDKLKEITGLQKSDIKYWHIDRLSTIIEADKHPKIKVLFNEAGIGDLLGFKDVFCGSETMPNINIDGLMSYIEQGKKETEEESPVESTFHLEELI